MFISKLQEFDKKQMVSKSANLPQSPEKFENSIGMQFVLIHPGKFIMGSRLSVSELVQQYGGKVDDYAGEYPPHEVIISNAYYLQNTPVTQGQLASNSFGDVGELVDLLRRRQYNIGMPRQARLDFPGTLHHVICRGIEKQEIAQRVSGAQGQDYCLAIVPCGR